MESFQGKVFTMHHFTWRKMGFDNSKDRTNPILRRQMYKQLFKCVYAEKIVLKPRMNLTQIPNTRGSPGGGLREGIYFLLCFLYPSCSHNKIREQNVFWRTGILPCLPTGAAAAVPMDCRRARAQHGEALGAPPSASPSPLRQRRVAMRGHQGAECGDSDKCPTSVKSLLTTAPGHPPEQERLDAGVIKALVPLG